MTAARHFRLEGRPRAVFFCLATLSLMLTGCSVGSGRSVMDAASVFSDDDTSALAESIPYASLDFHVAGNGGLVILASETGSMTYWQFQDASTIALQDGYLRSTAGFEQNLIDTQISDVDGEDLSTSPWRQQAATYRITREWQTADGNTLHGTATASLDCQAPTTVVLPLTTRALQTCRERLEWDSGATTYGTLWRAPEDGRLWAVETQPWPDAPLFDWQVARPW